MRLELYGCKEGFTPVPGPVCLDSLGMETGKIPDSDITASSFRFELSAPHFARLNKRKAWISSISDEFQWIQVKFSRRVNIRLVATQGRRNYDRRVTSYSLNYSSDGRDWNQYQSNKQQTVFIGNTDHSTVVTNVLNPPILTKYIRLLPVTWNVRIALRMDFYGCILDPPIPTALYPLNSKFGTKDLSSTQNPAAIPSNVQLAPGPFGAPNGSYKLSGSPSSYIEFPNNGGLNTRKSLTLLCWVFPENANGPIFHYGINYLGVHLWVVADKLLARIVSTAAVHPPVLTSDTLERKKWHFVGTSYDYKSGVQKLWVDGKVYDVHNIRSFEIDTRSAVRMGVKTGDRRVFKGRLSCMQVYNTALTEMEVHAARGMCNHRVHLRPVAFYPLNGQFDTSDISLRSNPPGESNDVDLAPGPDGSPGGSYYFNGTSTSFIKFPNKGGLDTKYSMTFLGWINYEQTEGPIFYYADSNVGLGKFGNRFLLWGGRFKILIPQMANFTTLASISSDILEPQTWHFVGVSYDYVSGETKLWINGSENRVKYAVWPSETATRQGVVMGAIKNYPGYFKGRISCILLYDRVLTKPEIEDAMELCRTAGRSIADQTVHLGETVELKCDALEGKTVRWSKDGVVLQTRTAGYGTSLRISSVQQGDEGIYTCDVISNTGMFQASYNVTLRVEDPSSLCSTNSIEDPKFDIKWKPNPRSIFPFNNGRVFNYERWFKLEKGSAIFTSCVTEERCGVQAPGWLSGLIPSHEVGIFHGQVCFNFRKDCCYYSLPIQIKRCPNFYVFKLKEIHPLIPGKYCFRISRADFPDSVDDFMYTYTKADFVSAGQMIASEKPVGSSELCMRSCSNFGRRCLSFNYNNVTQVCELYNETGRQQTGFRDMQKVYTSRHYNFNEGDLIRLP